MSPENIVSPFPTAPELLTAEEAEFASTSLIARAGETRPIEGVSQTPDVWALLVRMAETDPGQLARLELRMRVAMREANCLDAEAQKFNFKPIRDEAKQNERSRDKKVKDLFARRRRNDELIKSGRADNEITEILELPTDAQMDALSSSLALIARAWLSANRKKRVWYDSFANNVFTDWDGSLDERVVPTQAVDDQWRLRTYFTLMRANIKLGKLGEKASLLATNHMAFEDTRNAPKEWLKALEWDKVPRLNTWLTTVYGTPQDEYHAAVGRNWLIGMVARIIKKGDKMDNMPVLIGGEGIRKSTSLEILGGKLRQAQRERHYYGSINVSAEKMTDFLMTLNGLMVAEVAELDALMNRRTEHSRVKTIITTTEDIYRPPYGHAPSINLRSPVLVGTTNEFHWNNFEGIGRRFWPFECNRLIDTDWLIANRDQLFAEAYVQYTAGATWDKVPLDGHQRQMREHRIDDPLEEDISNWLETAPRIHTGSGCRIEAIRADPSQVEDEARWGTVVTTGRLLGQALRMQPDRRAHTPSRKVASVMRNLGWKSQSVRCGSGRDAPTVQGWVKRDDLTSKQGQLFDKTNE